MVEFREARVWTGTLYQALGGPAYEVACRQQCLRQVCLFSDRCINAEALRRNAAPTVADLLAEKR